MSPGLGVVILDLDQHEITRRCLRSIARGNRLPDLVILVLNGREPINLDIDRGLQTIVLAPGRNLGCAGGRNLGLNYLARNTTLNTFVILDNDTVVPPDFVEKLLRDPPRDMSANAPVIFDLEAQRVWSAGGTIQPDGSVRQITERPDRLEPPRGVDWAPGACLVINRMTWSIVGEFDAWINFLFDDIEWCCRLTRAGGSVVIRPDLQLNHEPNQSLDGAMSDARTYYWARNGTYFRLAVIRVGPDPAIRWLCSELRTAVSEAASGDIGRALTRIRGLAHGVFASRRKLAESP